jgi:hypothetical protein
MWGFGPASSRVHGFSRLSNLGVAEAFGECAGSGCVLLLVVGVLGDVSCEAHAGGQSFGCVYHWSVAQSCARRHTLLRAMLVSIIIITRS